VPPIRLPPNSGPRGIRSNAIAPGCLVTDGTRPVHDDGRFSEMICTTLGRCGDPKELVGIAVFLMSVASSYVNGATIRVDGGVIAAR